MLDYEDFVKEFTNELKQKMPDAEITRMNAKKANVTLDALSVRTGESIPGMDHAQAAPLIYLRDAYNQHKDGFTPEECADALRDFLDESRHDLPSLPPINKDTAREQLYAIVLNKEMSKDYLQDAITKDIPGTDLALAARCHLGEIRGTQASFLVKEANCPLLEMSPSEAMETALENSARADYRCSSLAETFADMMRKEGAPQEAIDEMLSSQDMMPPVFVLTNKACENGAVAVAFPDVMKDACAALGEERCYVIPSSRHEVLLIPESFGKEAGTDALSAMVKEVNQNEVALEDQLSDKIYLWNGKALVMADTKEMSQGLLRGQETPFGSGSDDTKTVKKEAPTKPMARSR